MKARPFKQGGSSLTGKVKSPWGAKPSGSGRRAGPAPAAGDYYGTGVKAPVGRVRDSSSPGMRPVNKKQLGKPPRSLA